MWYCMSFLPSLRVAKSNPINGKDSKVSPNLKLHEGFQVQKLESKFTSIIVSTQEEIISESFRAYNLFRDYEHMHICKLMVLCHKFFSFLSM